jgi:virginiamycin B lyase
MIRLLGALAVSVLLWAEGAAAQTPRLYPLPDGAAPIALATDAGGAVWFASRGTGAIGRLDPESGEVALLSLGHGAQPSSLVAGPDGSLFATDAVENLIYRVDPTSREVVRFPLDGPGGPLELNSVAFDDRERLWFTGYAGYFGWLDPRTGHSVLLPAPGGRGAGALANAGAALWFASYASDAAIRIDPETLRTEVFALPADQQGPKSLAVGQEGEIWIAAYQSRALLRLDSRTSEWGAWPLPGAEAKPFGIALDPKGNVHVSDVGRSQLITFDRATRSFTQSVDFGEGCMARAILPSGSGIWVAETRCDRLRLVGLDGDSAER